MVFQNCCFAPSPWWLVVNAVSRNRSLPVVWLHRGLGTITFIAKIKETNPFTRPAVNIKLLSNELDIYFHVVASKLWRHTVPCAIGYHIISIKRASQTESISYDRLFIAMFAVYYVLQEMGLFMYCRNGLFISSQGLSFWCVFLSLLRNSRSREIKTTLSWAHKQFVTNVQT